MLILLSNEFPNEEFNKNAGKGSWIVLLEDKAPIVYSFFALISFVLMLFTEAVGDMRKAAILALPMLLLAHAAANYLQKKEKGKDFLFGKFKTIQAYFLVGILLTASFILARFV